MTLPFPSPEWVAAYVTAINASGAYRQAATGWTHGPVALVVNARPEIGLADAVGIWLDLERGECRAAKMVSLEEAKQAPFVLSSDYARWKLRAFERLRSLEADPPKGAGADRGDHAAEGGVAGLARDHGAVSAGGRVAGGGGDHRPHAVSR